MRNKPLLRGALLTGLLLGGVYEIGHIEPASAAPTSPSNAPEVPVARVVVRDVAETVEVTGKTRAAGEVALRARVPGFIEEVAFKEGSVVKKGQLLFRLDARAQRAAVARARADLARAQHDLTLATLKAERGDKLAPDGIISPTAHDALLAERAKAQAIVAAAQAALDAAELELSYARVVSPIDGRAGEALVKAGNLVSGGSDHATLLTTIVSIRPLHVVFDVDEPTYRKLTSGGSGGEAESQVHVALAGDADFGRGAALDFLGNALDASTGTALARAVLPNVDGSLSPGLFARVRLQTSTPKPAVLLGDRAVFTDQSGRYVLVLNAQNIIEPRRIELGATYEGLRVVESGLSRDDRVVMSSMVRPGMQVTPREVDMATGAAKVASRGTP